MRARRTVDDPHDRLTAIADRMLTLAAGEDGIRAIVLLADGLEAGLGATGYAESENDQDVMLDMLHHLRALLQVNGRDLHIVPIVGQG